MRQRPIHARRTRTDPVRALIASLLVPLLLLVQVLGGRSALFHAHGTAGGHVHVLSVHADDHDHRPSAAWHRAQHEHEDPLPAPTEECVEDVDGILLHVPETVAAASREPGPSKSAAQLLPIRSGDVDCIPRVCERPPRATAPPERPQVRSRRSGIAALLRSSRALLI